jgi:hypothetical protein
MAVFTILVDNREQKPWLFEGYPVETRNVTLKTGDYTLEQFCEYDDANDTYIPNLAVERKAPPTSSAPSLVAESGSRVKSSGLKTGTMNSRCTLKRRGMTSRTATLKS